jgi:hypothetical protein
VIYDISDFRFAISETSKGFVVSVTSVVNDLKEVRDGDPPSQNSGVARDTIASTRDARAPQNSVETTDATP